MKIYQAIEFRKLLNISILIKPVLICSVLFLCCYGNASGNAKVPPYSDTAGTVFDIIQASDHSTFECLVYKHVVKRIIWDKRVNGEPRQQFYLFNATYQDQNPVEILINREFNDLQQVQEQAEQLAESFGRLPLVVRFDVKAIWVHDGSEGFHAGTGNIVLYKNTIDNRIEYNHLEESLFHESIHASWDAKLAASEIWLEAQLADGGFLTSYAERNPEREDLAETALFAFSLLNHPGRIPPVDERDTFVSVPHRINVIKEFLTNHQKYLGDINERQDDSTGCK